MGDIIIRFSWPPYKKDNHDTRECTRLEKTVLATLGINADGRPGRPDGVGYGVEWEVTSAKPGSDPNIKKRIDAYYGRIFRIKHSEPHKRLALIFMLPSPDLLKSARRHTLSDVIFGVWQGQRIGGNSHYTLEYHDGNRVTMMNLKTFCTGL